MFRNRAQGQELTDAPDCDAELARQSYALMRFVNRVGGGTRAVRAFLQRELAGAPRPQTWRILDLGAGSCDISRAIVKWAHRHGHRVEITCVDHNAAALERARAALAGPDSGPITLETADIFAYRPEEAFDYALASMVLHHFTAEEIRTLVAHLSHFVRRALLINDLRRCALNYLACHLTACPCHPTVRHDALLSVRRGFTCRDLSHILSAGAMPWAVRNAWFCRITGIVRFDGKGTE